MRQYKERTTIGKEVSKIVCNKCGKEIKIENGILKEDVLSIEKKWGYFSGKDNENHHFDLCEECYDKMIHSFKIPVEDEV